MNHTAMIDGKEYSFLEELSSPDEQKSFILCADDSGRRFVCPKSAWQDGAPQNDSGLAVHARSSVQEKIQCFLSTFRGRPDLYARRYYSVKTGKSGYTPACKNEWASGLCDKRKHKCPDCPNREFMPLSFDAVKAHLIGSDAHCRDVAAIYPMLEDNTTWLLATDFDEENWKSDVDAFRRCCAEIGLHPAVERSRSGNGAHVWFFFSELVSAADARRLGSGLLTRTMARRHELSFASYDRLFPSQDTIPTGGFGNLIALPFQGQAQKNGNSLFVNEQFMPYPDQWAYLSAIPRITPERLGECLSVLCQEGDVGALAEEAKAQEPWRRKRSGKKLTRTDFPPRAVITVSNLIYLRKDGFSQAALNAIKRLAAFPNPEFRSRQAMRLPVYGTPRIIDCGYEDNTYIGVPRGCGESLTELLEQHDVPIDADDRRCAGREIRVSFHGTLRPEQIPAADALLAGEIGVLSATTAFGKTVIGAYLIGQRKVNTLILVHSSALLEQWAKSLGEFLIIDEVLPELPKKRGRKKKRCLIGQIGAGKDTHSGIIDIATMQSLFEGPEKDVKAFVEDYGMVIVDECHHVAAFTFEKVLKTAKARYVYGLSATPVRKDGHHPIIFMQCGPVRYLVDAKSQAEKREFAHFVIPRFTRTRAPAGSKIQDLYDLIVKNEARNTEITEDALKLVAEGRTPILLTERKEHAARLSELLTKRCRNVFLLVGSDKPREKQEKLALLQALPADEAAVVVATGKYIGEGFDSPRLDTLLLTMPISWKGTLAQYAGRLHRSYAGKHEVRIYDYVDVHIPMLERMYHKRLKGYSELGYQVKFGSSAEPVSLVYNGNAAVPAFEQDLSDASQSITIVSPYMHRKRIVKLLPLLQEAVARGVKVEIHTAGDTDAEDSRRQEIADIIAMLRQSDIDAVIHDGLQHRYAVLDESTVWYGNVDLLAFGRKDTEIIRFQNTDIAGELLSMVSVSEAEQLMLTDLPVSDPLEQPGSETP